jgi:prolyl-tRNA synthetase
MRWSASYIPTLKEAPRDAEVVSHKLLSRAGFIRQLTSGVYTFLPMGLRALNKVADIVREEMNHAGAQEILMPMVQPAELWKETGRWDFYGRELLRIKDRKDSDFCLGPTHEEVITDLVRGEIRSYRQLPLNLYQIQTKFRDEIRPRFGLMRCREFVMKDAYSFDRDEAGAEASYKNMFNAYMAIFKRLGLDFKPVEADSGSIGGSFSHEFMVLADTGEDTIATCPACEYAANLEKAVAAPLPETSQAPCAPVAQVATPDQHTVEEIAAFLETKSKKIIKTLLFEVDGKAVAALVRGDHELNEIKLKNHLNATNIALATPEQVKAWSGAEVGFAGPVGLKVETIVADLSLRNGNDWVAGANATDTHVLHLNLARDCSIENFADLRDVTEGDLCPRCSAPMELKKGIEVGHVFKLGSKYSEPMNANFLDENGKEQTMVMGCYGIGVSRIVASAIEQNHDENGIMLPPTIAPFEAVVISLGGKNQDVNDKAAEIYETISELGVDTIYDDRAERPGVKFKDADLVGFPMQVVLGGKGLAKGIVEAKDRRTGEKTELPIDGFEQAFAQWRTQVWARWNLASE